MNVVNKPDTLSFQAVPGKRRHTISVIQFATVLAFVALPATVLFPTVARPVETPGISDDVQLGLSAAVNPNQCLRHSFAHFSLKQHFRQAERTIARNYKKYSTIHITHQDS